MLCHLGFYWGLLIYISYIYIYIITLNHLGFTDLYIIYIYIYIYHHFECHTEVTFENTALTPAYYLARRSLCEIINSTLGMLIHRWIGGTLFRTCITLKSKQRESGASESPCFSQMHSEMRLSMFLQKEMT